jgi:BirA family biotin operon repressor/biotin-[acetyl-CoA-carboxylase] ligase
MGRSFYSPKYSGIYLSIILRQKIDAENSIKITTAAAVSVARVIEKFSDKKAYIKGVNDIFVDSKKVCGILTESVFKKDSAKIEYSVLGIGINLTTPKGGFPKEIKDIAGGIFESADNELKLQMAEEIINDFMSIYINLEQDDFYREYKNRSIVLGKEISFLKDGQTVLAKVADIDDKCRLVVEKQNGDREIISTGEVSLGSENFINN